MSTSRVLPAFTLYIRPVFYSFRMWKKVNCPLWDIIESIDSISIIESIDSISRDERDVPLTQYITNA